MNADEFRAALLALPTPPLRGGVSSWDVRPTVMAERRREAAAVEARLMQPRFVFADDERTILRTAYLAARRGT